MKKLTLTTFALLAIIAIFYVSCTQENVSNTESNQTSFRESFIKDLSVSEQKIEFKKLSDLEQSKLWNEKLNHLKSLDLPNQHLSLINDLQIELKNNGYLKNQNTTKIIEITKELFRITPAEDLKCMFFCLDNYAYKGNFDTSSGYLEFADSNLQKIANNNATSKTAVEECTCRWTCSESGHTNCTETSWGCGLLWLWSCTKRLT